MQTQPQLLLLQKTMVVVEGVARKLNPETNIWETSKPVLEKWLTETKDPISSINKRLKDSIEAVKKFLQSRKVKSSNIDLVGFHGHTIAHGVCGKHFSHQIGNGSLLAKKLGIDVINDFRSNDIAKGGQGAPLAPIFHTAIIGKRSDPSVFVNVGKIFSMNKTIRRKNLFSENRKF